MFASLHIPVKNIECPFLLTIGHIKKQYKLFSITLSVVYWTFHIESTALSYSIQLERRQSEHFFGRPQHLLRVCNHHNTHM